MPAKIMKLVPVVCPKCKQHLIDTVPGCSVICKKCKRWVDAKKA